MVPLYQWSSNLNDPPNILYNSYRFYNSIDSIEPCAYIQKFYISACFPDHDDQSATSKSFRFDRSDLGALASYVELWWAELLQMSSPMRNFLQKQRNLDLNFSAFNDPFGVPLDLEDEEACIGNMTEDFSLKAVIKCFDTG